jgi:hypothetical protein
MPSRTHAVLAIACAAVVVMPPFAPAHASIAAATSRNHRVIDDATFDVTQPSEQNGAEEEFVPAADRAIGDITRFEVRHGEHRVRFRISAQELLRPIVDDTYESVFAGVSVRTDAGNFYAFVVLGNYDTRSVMFVGRQDEEPRSCAGKARSFDESSDTLTLSLPRRCLGEPRWVQAIGSISYSWPGGGDGDYYVDLAPDQTIEGPANFTRRAWHPAVTR